MKIFFTCLLSLLLAEIGLSQSCLPDSTYLDSTAGVYPRPISPDYPNGGIKKKACINKFYDVTLTVVIPDSILIPQFPTPIPLDRASIATKDAISNLPEGITYVCNPPNCIFEKNTIGCVQLYGIPTSNNTPGNFKPVIKLTITAFGGFIVQTVDFPGPVFPGEYIIELLAENNCASATGDVIEINKNWYPNPNQGILYSQTKNIIDFTIEDLSGKILYYCKEMNSNPIDLHLASGMHIIKWKNGNQRYAQKLIVL